VKNEWVRPTSALVVPTGAHGPAGNPISQQVPLANLFDSLDYHPPPRPRGPLGDGERVPSANDGECIDLAGADLVVGTSAGSILGAQVCSDNLPKFAALMRFAVRTRLFEYLRNDAKPKPTADRARALFEDAAEGGKDTVLGIGHAALAAQAPSQYALFAQVIALTRHLRWPSASLRTTSYDTYTGERHVYSSRCGVPLVKAVAASASVPGLMQPVQLGPHRLMDGGLVSGANSDLAIGAERALVIGLVNDPTLEKWANRPDQWDEEVAALAAAGTHTYVRLPAEDLGDPMDATTLPLGLALGTRQATLDIARVREFWTY